MANFNNSCLSVVRQMTKFRITIIIIILLFSLVTLSHARATVESLSQVEKIFLQGKYDRVVSESGRSMRELTGGRSFYILKA
jgi:hypothetical protein